MPVDIEDRLAALRSTGHLPSLADPADLRRTGASRTRRKRAATAIVGAACLTIVGVVVALGMGGSPGGRSVNRPSVDPAASRPVVAGASIESGVVTYNGNPVAGATVYGVLQPVGAALGSLSVGDQVPQWTLNPVTTSADGTYHLTLDPATIPATFIDSTDVQIEVSVIYGSQEGTWGTSLKICATTAARSGWCSDETTKAPTISFDLGRKPTVLDDTNPFHHTWQPLMVMPPGPVPPVGQS